MTFEEAKGELDRLRAEHGGDAEYFHSLYDRLIERRLAELDPDFAAKMAAYYEESGIARWYA